MLELPLVLPLPLQQRHHLCLHCSWGCGNISSLKLRLRLPLPPMPLYPDCAVAATTTAAAAADAEAVMTLHFRCRHCALQLCCCSQHCQRCSCG